jgi:hypothetical protein
MENNALYAAIAERKSLEVIRDIVRENPEPVRTGVGREWLPLHFAARSAAPVDLVRFLVDSYPGALQETDDEERLPLHLAAKRKARVEAQRNETFEIGLEGRHARELVT